MGQIVFIIWREAVEALLVIAVLDTWLVHNTAPAARRLGRGMLWAGVVAGLGLAGALGWALMFAYDAFGEGTQELIQATIILGAAALIVQTVLWSRRAGGERQAIEAQVQAAPRGAWWLPVFLVSALAVAREGSESFVFIWGSLASADADPLVAPAGIGLGLAAAVATYFAIRGGSRVLSWPLFFRLSEVALLLLAGALLMSGLDQLAGLDLIPVTEPLWDTSFLIDDTAPLGSLLSSLTGYRARPDAVQLGVYTAYWLAMLGLVGRPVRNVRIPAAAE